MVNSLIKVNNNSTEQTIHNHDKLVGDLGKWIINKPHLISKNIYEHYMNEQLPDLTTEYCSSGKYRSDMFKLANEFIESYYHHLDGKVTHIKGTQSFVDSLTYNNQLDLFMNLFESPSTTITILKEFTKNNFEIPNMFTLASNMCQKIYSLSTNNNINEAHYEELTSISYKKVQSRKSVHIYNPIYAAQCLIMFDNRLGGRTRNKLYSATKEQGINQINQLFYRDYDQQGKLIENIEQTNQKTKDENISQTTQTNTTYYRDPNKIKIQYDLMDNDSIQAQAIQICDDKYNNIIDVKNNEKIRDLVELMIYELGFNKTFKIISDTLTDLTQYNTDFNEHDIYDTVYMSLPIKLQDTINRANLAKWRKNKGTVRHSKVDDNAMAVNGHISALYLDKKEWAKQKAIELSKRYNIYDLETISTISLALFLTNEKTVINAINANEKNPNRRHSKDFYKYMPSGFWSKTKNAKHTIKQFNEMINYESSDIKNLNMLITLQDNNQIVINLNDFQIRGFEHENDKPKLNNTTKEIIEYVERNPSSNKNIDYRQFAGGRRILIEWEESNSTEQTEQMAIQTAIDYSNLVNSIADIVQDEIQGYHGKRKEEEAIIVIHGIIYSNLEFEYELRETIHKCMETNKWDCDTSATLIYDIFNLIGINANLVEVPGHMLLKTDNYYFETTRVSAPGYYTKINPKYDYHQIFEHDQTDLVAHINGFGLAIKQGRTNDMLIIAEKMVALKPDSVMGGNYRAAAFVELNAQQSALNDLNYTSQIYPNDPYNYYNRGKISKKLGRYDEAIDYFLQSKKFGMRKDIIEIEINLIRQRIRKYASNK